MNDLTSQPWFSWALAVAIGVPVLLIALNELHSALVRRGSALSGPVATLRTWVVPATALWVLLTQAWDVSEDETWVRLIATVVGFVLLLIVLAALNVVLFGTAATGSWRQRLPSIFVDIARLVLIVAGLAVLFSWVWGANVGGLFAALGVTSIVLGFALQNAVGSIISGLLLLFEQPFRIGDWLSTGSAKGRVVEVNWRAVHLDTGAGIQIIPNASLAGSAFTNLSEPAGAHPVTLVTTFGADDRPEAVRRLLDAVAADLPLLHEGSTPRTAMAGTATFHTVVALTSPSDIDDVAAVFHRWVWYAARRNGLHLAGGGAAVVGATTAEDGVGRVAASLHLRSDEVAAVAATARVELWAGGEIMQRIGQVPDGLRFVLAGSIALEVPTGSGRVEVAELSTGDYFGQAVLTREPVVTEGRALDEVTTLYLPKGTIDELVRTRARLARELGQAIDLRRSQARAAIADGARAAAHRPAAAVVATG